MTREEFEKIIEEEFPRAVPEKFHHLIKNVGFLVEDEAPERDLLGQYHGVPHTARGDWYGVGGTLPDTITLYQKTIEEYAQQMRLPVAQVVRETIWHEVAHYMGYDEEQVRGRESKRNDIV
jgi:predicted Zn-dependent protease with MMP-like domain